MHANVFPMEGAGPRPGPNRRGAPMRPGLQTGFTLVELMVGIAIGLLVVAVAMGALMISRSVSGTVSDASIIQQQGAYAMRVLGQQLRQAGSLRLNLDPGTVTVPDAYMGPVAFQIRAVDPGNPSNSFDARKANEIVNGSAAPETLTVGYQRYPEPVFTNATDRSQVRDCIGGPADASTQPRIENIFQIVGIELRCNNQPIVRNVANFRVRYLFQDNVGTGIPTLKAIDAAGVGSQWANVQAVEVCVVIYGVEPIDLPATPPANDPSVSYTDCDGVTPVDLRSLATPRTRRMHVAFRNVFQLRSQGLIGPVLLPM